MSEKYIQCRNHENCGGLCETPEEIQAGFCENCLFEKSESESEAASLKAQRDELLEFVREVRRTGDTRLASMAIAVIAKTEGGAA